jgi:hypothetical protein
MLKLLMHINDIKSNCKLLRGSARIIYTKKSVLLARHVFRNKSCVLGQ